MAVKVLVTKVFECGTADEAAKRFRSLSQAGWDVFVDATQPQSPAASAVGGRDAAGLVSEIVERHGISVSAVSRLIGVSQPTLCNWQHGRHSPRSDLLHRLQSLAETARKLPPGVRLDGEAKPSPAKRRRRVARRLSDDEVLELALRKSDGEATASLAREYGISRSRVGRLVAKTGG